MAVGSPFIPQLPLPPERYSAADQRELRAMVRAALTDVHRIVQTIESDAAAGFALEDIGDVDAYSSIASGEVLMWDGDSWLHRTRVEAGLAGLADQNTFTAGGGQLAQTDTGGNRAWATRVDGDTTDRFHVSIDGTVLFSAGSGTQDVNLYRNAADELATDDDFRSGGILYVDQIEDDDAGSLTFDASEYIFNTGYIYEDVVADTARVRLRRQNAGASTVTAGNWLGGYQFWGYDGSTYRLGANIRAIVSEAFSGGSYGTDLVLYAVQDGNTGLSEFLRLDATAKTVKINGHGYNSIHFQLGNYHLWVDGSGRLRIKNGAPTSATDGTVVGTQS